MHLEHKICTKSHDVAFKISKFSRGKYSRTPEARRGGGSGRLTCSARIGFRPSPRPWVLVGFSLSQLALNQASNDYITN